MAAVSSLPFHCLTFFFCIVCLSLALAKQCNKLDTCSCKMDDGSGIVSLQDIDERSGDKASFVGIKDTISPTYTFDWNPCTPLKPSGPCQDNNVCQHTPDLFPAGTPETVFSVDSSSNVVLSYKKVLYKDGHTRYTKVTLKCDNNQPKGSFGDGIAENARDKTSEYTGTLASKCACPGKCNYSPNYFSSSSTGLSTGSILLIIFFPLIILYFVLGIVINKYARHKEGTDVIPNRSFWSDLPFLVKDGCVFSCGKLKVCCSSLCNKVKRDDSYTPI